jgi:hypothetical protein
MTQWSDSMNQSYRGIASKPSDLILRRLRSSRGRLEGWPRAWSRLWPSFETRARARSSGRGLMDDIDMIRIMETLY